MKFLILFEFIKYVAPGWYYSLPDLEQKQSFFLDFDKLSEREKSIITLDVDYSNSFVSKLDASYLALQKGYIKIDKEQSLHILENKLILSDNYRFIRKYFHPLWSWYVLVIRLLTFHNPFREIGAFFHNQKVKRVNLYEQVFPHEASYQQFESDLIAANPLVSVIIPTLNRYSYLKDVLEDLEKQDYRHFEVIVVDQSEPFQPDFYKAFALDLKVIRQEEKALWLARNTAIKIAKAEYLLLYDDDSRVEPDWITQHLKCLDYFQADISAGVSLSVVGATVPKNYSFFRWSDQLDTGNVLLRREVFRTIGLFDRQFEKQRMGDGEYGLRAYLAGFHNISNPYAKRIHLKVGEGGLRQMGSWDGFRPKSWLAPRPVPSVLYFYRKYFGNESAIYAVIIGVLPSLLPYRFKRNNYLMLVSIMLSLVILPIIFIQVLRSWNLSSQKLKQGALIEPFE